MGGECGIDFKAIRTRYYFRGTLLEFIQNREGVSQKIREIILGRKKKTRGEFTKLNLFLQRYYLR